MSNRGAWLRDSLLYVLGGSFGTLCRGGTGGPSRGRKGRGGEGRVIFLEAGLWLGVIGGEEEAVEVTGGGAVIEGKKA